MDASAVITTIAAIVIVVLIVLVILLGLLLKSGAASNIVTGGNAEHQHLLGKAIHDYRFENAKGYDAESPLPQLLEPRTSIVKTIGGAEKKHWTAYKTWTALRKDKKALRAYETDVVDVLGNLNLDWSGVMVELKDILHDDREWAGRINIVDGKPKIVELVPSPSKIGEGSLSEGSAAEVPGEVIAKLARKPALFMFHTHPSEDPGPAAMPSPTDFAGSIWLAYDGNFAADLMISPYGVFMYTPGVRFRREIWSEPDVRHVRLATLRKIVDMLGALGGSRSWKSPWSLKDFADMVSRYGIDYVVFPTDKYAQAFYRMKYMTKYPPSGDVNEYHKEIKALEKEIQAENVTRNKKKSKAA